MVDSKVFLQSHISKQSSNTSNGVNVQLKGKRKLLPTTDMSESVSQYEQYLEERGKCNKIRLTCQVNPICSNVLYNSVTEIVRNEGSDDVEVLNYGNEALSKGTIKTENTSGKNKKVDFWSSPSWNGDALTILNGNAKDSHPTNAIRDTQLSSPSNGFVYHCGKDIFNNHLIRSNTFKTICKRQGGNEDTFNTIADKMRDVKGNEVVETLYFPVDAPIDGHKKDVTMHVYRYDDILTYADSVKNRLVQKYDGWVGFYNRSKIKSYNDFKKGEIMDIERPIMYKNGGDFIEMYPDRSLYSFVPKFNKSRKRVEKNWEYCITYPSSSTTDGFDSIINKSNGALKAIYFDENSKGDNGGSQLVIYGISKHGLIVGDFVSVYKTLRNGTDERVVESAEVSAVVDDYIFVLKGNSTAISNSWYDVSQKDLDNGCIEVDGVCYSLAPNKKYFTGSYPCSGCTSGCSGCTTSTDNNKYYLVNGKYVNLDLDSQHISYKKVVNGIECNYYVRIFSKVPNFKNASAVTSSEYDIYKDDSKLIKEYQGSDYDFESHVSRLAFAKNIYGDEIGEVVFTDDIDVSNLKDNLGRPLSTLYITFLKSNGGYKEWYGFDNVPIYPPNDKVTYSHCFGALTCGYETSDESIYTNDINSINKINNIGGDAMGVNVSYINKDWRNSQSNGTENSHPNGTENSYFNATEVAYGVDKNFYGDLCFYDEYNATEVSIQPMMYRFNTAQRESILSSSSDKFNGYNYDDIVYDDYDISNTFTVKTSQVSGTNSRKEGYYYKPHYPIEIKMFGKLNSVSPDFLKIRSIKKEDDVYSIVTSSYHYLGVGDKAMIYDSTQEKYYTLVTVKNNNSNYKKFYCKVYSEDGKTLEKLTFMDGDGKSHDLLNTNDDVARGLYMSDFKLFKVDNLEIPSYAKILKDGTCRYVWRDIINNGFNPTVSSVEEYPFTNGAFYINKRIDIYVRRQDPYNMYGLYNDDDISGDDSKTEVIVDDSYVKSDDIKC